jgi:hypothetical protein
MTQPGDGPRDHITLYLGPTSLFVQAMHAALRACKEGSRAKRGTAGSSTGVLFEGDEEVDERDLYDMDEGDGTIRVPTFKVGYQNASFWFTMNVSRCSLPCMYLVDVQLYQQLALMYVRLFGVYLKCTWTHIVLPL